MGRRLCAPRFGGPGSAHLDQAARVALLSSQAPDCVTKCVHAFAELAGNVRTQQDTKACQVDQEKTRGDAGTLADMRYDRFGTVRC